jgi:plasmid stability protein
MVKTLQIRNVPDHVHKTVRARADRAGISVSDYLRALITELALHPTIAEIIERPETLVSTNSNDRPHGARTPGPRKS